ncbi:MAG: hypothetical protein GDA36_09250 [Rhodobacteraceae bacterium]|nr:hypothetical protein [Paracoccaceae bacterium]
MPPVINYAAIAAIGVIGAGAAPVPVFDTPVDGLAPGAGVWCFLSTTTRWTTPGTRPG